MPKTKAYISSSDESGSSDEQALDDVLGQFEFEQQVKRVEPVVTDSPKAIKNPVKGQDSEDVEPPPKKSKTAVKKKPSTPPAKSSSAGVKVGNEVRFELGKLKFATVSEFKGRKMVNIREFYMTAEGELRPGKKGLALMPDQWEKLKANMDEIDAALDNL